MDQRGIDATTLVERSRVMKTARPLDAAALERWLIRQQLAVCSDGLLRPTSRCLELAAGLRGLEGRDGDARTWTRRA